MTMEIGSLAAEMDGNVVRIGLHAQDFSIVEYLAIVLA
jgi:hypothetical protein